MPEQIPIKSRLAISTEYHPTRWPLDNPVMRQDIQSRMRTSPVQSKSGHAFIKERMRDEDAIYGGEMSAHHYFRDFAYADSGMIPWLLVAGIITLIVAAVFETYYTRIALGWLR